MTLPDAAPSGAEGAPRDIIAWRQILIGYAMVLTMLLVVWMVHADLFPDRREGKGPLTLAVLAATILSVALAKPAAALHRFLLSGRPRLDDALQRIAIALLLALSAATIAYGVLTLRPNGGAW